MAVCPEEELVENEKSRKEAALKEPTPDRGGGQYSRAPVIGN